jgi:hypothetical protein
MFHVKHRAAGFQRGRNTATRPSRSLDPAVLDAVGETVAQLAIDLSDQ